VVIVKSSYTIPVYGPHHAPEFHDDDQVAVEVINKGGQPVTVLNFGVRVGRAKKSGNLFVTSPHILSARLPAAVDPGGEPARVMVPVDSLRHASREHDVPFRDMRAWVDLGDGRRVYSDNSIPLK